MKHTLLIVASLLAAFLFSSLLVPSLVGFLGFDSAADDGGLALMISYAGAMALTIAILLTLKRPLALKVSSLAPRIDKINLPLTLMGLVLIGVAGVAIDPIMKLMPESWTSLLDDMMDAGIWAIVTSVVLAPIMEEYLFRGMLQRSITTCHGAIGGIVIASVVFGLIHIIPQQVLAASLSGLVLGTIFYLTGSLTTVVMIHMLNNGLAYLQFMFLGQDFDPMELLFPSTSAYSVAVVVAWVIFAGAVVVGVRKVRKIGKN